MIRSREWHARLRDLEVSVDRWRATAPWQDGYAGRLWDLSDAAAALAEQHELEAVEAEAGDGQ